MKVLKSKYSKQKFYCISKHEDNCIFVYSEIIHSYISDELSRQFANCDVNLVITIDMFMPKVNVIKTNLSCYKGTVVISETGKSENGL